MSNPTEITINQNPDGSYDIPAIHLVPSAASTPVSPPPPPPPPPPSAPTAGFSVSVNGLVVVVTDTSTNAVSESWDFGDGASSTTSGDQIHSYAAGGDYTIAQTVTGADGTQVSSSQTVTVSAPAAPPSGGDTAPNAGAYQDGDTYTPPADA